MTTPEKTVTSNVATITGTRWDVAFWFAVLSPALGVVVGFIALLLFYH
jgi:hypothetical protein